MRSWLSHICVCNGWVWWDMALEAVFLGDRCACGECTMCVCNMCVCTTCVCSICCNLMCVGVGFDADVCVAWLAHTWDTHETRVTRDWCAYVACSSHVRVCRVCDFWWNFVYVVCVLRGMSHMSSVQDSLRKYIMMSTWMNHVDVNDSQTWISHFKHEGSEGACWVNVTYLVARVVSLPELLAFCWKKSLICTGFFCKRDSAMQGAYLWLWLHIHLMQDAYM